MSPAEGCGEGREEQTPLGNSSGEGTEGRLRAAVRLPHGWRRFAQRSQSLHASLISLGGGSWVAMCGSQPTTTVQIKPATYNLRTLEPVATYNLRNPHIISQRSPKTAFLSVSGCRSDAHVCESVRWREISTGSAQSQRTRSAL